MDKSMAYTAECPCIDCGCSGWDGRPPSHSMTRRPACAPGACECAAIESTVIMVVRSSTDYASLVHRFRYSYNSTVSDLKNMAYIQNDYCTQAHFKHF